jgi:preprotein translocase subunit SecD
MHKNLRWKVLTILGVLAVAVFFFYPPQQKVKLGLDLKGGVHLVIRVQTDDALKMEVELTAERLREQLQQRGISGVTVTAEPPSRVRLAGVPPDREAEVRALAEEQTGQRFVRESGAGGEQVYALRPSELTNLSEGAVDQALQTIERRVNELGVAEPIISRHGTAGNQILVQLPGVTDVNRAKEIIRATARLEFKIIEDGPFPSQEALLQSRNGVLPPDMEVITGADRSQPGATSYYLVKRVAQVTGADLRDARPGLDENNLPAVHFTLTRDGGQKFGKLTGDNVNRPLSIILDNRVQSVANILERITDQGRIAGSFTREDVQDLSLMLRSGALPAGLTYLEERTIGPTLGADSIRAGVYASIGGLLLVALFMLTYYKLSGINAIVSVAMNLIILMGFMAQVGAVMTLPGIAGFILTIGMGVDSNVLIFERIKEELGNGKGPRSAIAAGFDRVFLTILDTHVASLISAAFLFQFGTGPIRGFATTLFFGLLSNVFTAVFVSRTLFELILSRRQSPQTMSI